MTRSSVRDLLLERLPVTIQLAVGAALVWLCIGIHIGVVSAVTASRWVSPSISGQYSSRVGASGTEAVSRTSRPKSAERRASTSA